MVVQIAPNQVTPEFASMFSLEAPTGIRSLYDATQGATVDWVPLALFARHADGSIIAGLTGSTYWGYLYVGRLWTDQRFRSLGIGSQLLAEAEQEARRRGCHAVHLMTGSFNALPFYQKRGYNVFGELPDMPPGHTQYFMRKEL